jgi:transposase
MLSLRHKCLTKSFLVKCCPVLRTIVCKVCDTSPSTSGAVSVRYVHTLTESPRHTLEHIMQHDPSPRARTRAHSILLSSRHVTIKESVKIYQVDRDTVSSWIKQWEQTGVESLDDKPRCGRPAKLTQEEKELAQQSIKEEPRCLKQVPERLSQKTAKRLSISSLKRLAKKARLRWKRVRKSLKSLRDPEEFAQCQRELEA